MATIQEVRQQLDTQKSQLQQAQQQSQNQLRQLQQAESKIPQFQSQTALRQTYPGVGGTVKRGMFQKIKEMVTGQKQKIKSYQGDINQVQQQLQQYEQTKLAPAEKEAQSIRAYNQAVDTIRNAARKGSSYVALHAQYDQGITKELALDWLKNHNLQKQNLRNEVQSFEISNPGEKLFVDWENLKIRGIESGNLAQSLPTSIYNQEVKKFQQASQNLPPQIQQGINDQAKINSIGGITPFMKDIIDSSNLGSSNLIKIKGGFNDGFNVQSRGGSGLFTGFSLRDNNLQSGLSNNSSFARGFSAFLEKGKTEAKRESYSSQLGGFVSASSEPKGTAIIRQPTMQERAEIERAQIKGSLAEIPIIKFASGNYEWQKEVEKRLAAKKVGMGDFKGINQWFTSQQGKGNLEDIPYSPQGFAPTGTRLFFEGTNQITSGLRNLGVDTSKQINIPKQTAEDIFLLGSLSLFDPLIRTGVASKTKLKEINKNKFEALKELFADIEKDVAKGKSAQEQAKTLLKYKKDYKLTDEDIKVIIQSLKEKEMIAPIDITKPVSKQTTPIGKIIFNIKGLPTQEGTSTLTSLGGIIKEINIKPEQIRDVDFLGTDLIKPVKEKTSDILSGSMFNELGKPKTKISNKLKLLESSGILSVQDLSLNTSQLQKTAQRTKQIQREIQKERTTQIPKTRLISSPKLKERTIQRTRNIGSPIIKPKEPTRKIRKGFPIIFPNNIKKKRKLIPKRTNRDERFWAITKRKGKEVIIGIGKTPKEAELLGKKDVLGRISATVKVKEARTGREIQLTPTGIFRQSKTDPLAIVQKARTRLTSVGEKREILSFRRIKQIKKPLQVL